MWDLTPRGRTLSDIIIATYFPFISKNNENKNKNKQMELIQTQKLLLGKGNNKQKRQSKDWEKIFTNDVTDKGLVSKIYKQLMTASKQTTHSTNEQKT